MLWKWVVSQMTPWTRHCRTTKNRHGGHLTAKLSSPTMSSSGVPMNYPKHRLTYTSMQFWALPQMAHLSIFYNMASLCHISENVSSCFRCCKKIIRQRPLVKNTQPDTVSWGSINTTTLLFENRLLSQFDSMELSFARQTYTLFFRRMYTYIISFHSWREFDGLWSLQCLSL